MIRLPPHLLVTLTSWSSRLLTSALALVNMRLLIEMLGHERYAGLVLLANLLGWFALLDFGLGHALQNQISERRARGEPHRALTRQVARRTLLLLGAGALLLYPLSVVIAPWYLASTAPAEASEHVLHFYVAGLLLVGTGVGLVAHKIWYAEQRGYLAHLASAAASVTTVTAVVVLRLRGGELSQTAAIVALLGPACAYNLFGLLRAAFMHAALDDRPTREDHLRLRGRAGRFALHALMVASFLHFDYLLISQVLSAQDIVLYSVATRGFEVINLFYSAALLALWPTVAEAIARQEWSGVLGYLRRYLGLGVVGIAGLTVVMVPLMPVLTGFLSPSEALTVPVTYVLQLGGLTLVRAWSNTFSMVLQSMSELRTLLVITPVQAVINAATQLLLAPRYGVYGVTLGLCASYLLTTCWLLPFEVLKRSRQTAPSPASPHPQP